MIKNVLVAGGGVLGSQIALQTAVSGFKVTVYDISEDSLQASKEKMEGFIPRYQEESKKDFGHQALDQALADIIFTTDLKEAAQDADLVVEAVPEKLDIKEDFYKQLAQVAPDHTIFATNTSTLLPSSFMEATSREDRFVALHFANEIWKKNTGEVMKTEKTTDETFQTVMDFAEDIAMVPIPIYKEKPGYILNTLFVPFLQSGSELHYSGFASAYDVDRAWIKTTGDDFGPFGGMDIVGIETVKNVNQSNLALGIYPDEEWIHNAIKDYNDLIEQGRGGKLNGKGYYNYDGIPEFLQDDFLADTPQVAIEDYGKESDDPEVDKVLHIYNFISTGIFKAALELVVNGYSEADMVDKVWETTHGWGPFKRMKEIGFDQVRQTIEKSLGNQATQEERKLLSYFE